MAAHSKTEFRRCFVEAKQHELDPENHTHAPRQSIDQRALCRVGLPALVGLYAQLFHVTMERGRFKPGEPADIEYRLVNWDRCSYEEIQHLRARITELKGLHDADEQLAACGLD